MSVSNDSVPLRPPHETRFLLQPAFGVTKAVAGIHVLPTRPLSGGGIPRRLLFPLVRQLGKLLLVVGGVVLGLEGFVEQALDLLVCKRGLLSPAYCENPLPKI